MWLVRVLTMKEQFDQIDRQLEKLRRLIRQPSRIQEYPHETGL